MADTIIRDDQLPQGAPPSGRLYVDLLDEVHTLKYDARIPGVMDALGIEEEPARKLIMALLG